MRWIILLALLFFIQSHTFAQFGYMYFKAGYSIPALKNDLHEFYNHSKAENNKYVDTKIPVSFGNGSNFTIGMENFFNNNIGFDFSINYQPKSKYTFTNESVIMTVTKTTQSVVEARRWGFTPSMVFYTQFEDLYLSLKTGIIISAPKIVLTNTIDIDTSQTKEIWEYNTPLTLGFSSTFSASYLLKEKYLISLNLGFSALKCSPKSASLTFAQKNNLNILKNLKTYYKEKNYVDQLDLEYNTNPDYDKPQQLMKDYYSFSNFEISVTIAYLLWKD